MKNKPKGLRKLERIEEVTTRLWAAMALGAVFLIGQPVKVVLFWSGVTLALFAVSIWADEKQKPYYVKEEDEYIVEDY